KIELRKERVELSTVIATAVETSRPLIDVAGHQFTVDLWPEPLFLDADPVRLAQVVANLLNNAAKYTPDRGQIRLLTRRQQDEAVIIVQDTGLGISPEMLPKVFDMFSQIDRTRARA